MTTQQSYAEEMDAKDPLRKFRDRFIIPNENGKEKIYFLGNSLGLQPKTTGDYLKRVLADWSEHGVEGFFRGDDPWLKRHDLLAAPLAEIVGALPNEVVVMNQLTVNLHLMLISFYKPAGKRFKIICEAKAFPSDQYMLDSHIRYHGLDPAEVLIEIAPRRGKDTIAHEDIMAAIEANSHELALVFFGGVNYYTGQLFDIAAITAAAHAAGAKAGFDLAHAAGNVPLSLHEWDVDFACWCSYKYLNSGPGAIAAAYIHERYHTDQSLDRFAGWWGEDKQERFLMEKHFRPAESAEGWQLSTPSILLYAAHQASLEIFREATMPALVDKGSRLSDYLIFLLHDINEQAGRRVVHILTPTNAKEKGCQVSISVPGSGPRVFDAIVQHGVFADWREPDVIRVAPVPLYNTFSEVWQFARIVEKILKGE